MQVLQKFNNIFGNLSIKDLMCAHLFKHLAMPSGALSNIQRMEYFFKRRLLQAMDHVVVEQDV